MITETSTNAWVGRKVNSVIVDSGIKKKAIAEKTGMPYSTLNSKIHGYSPFTLDDLIRIAEVTSHSPMDFIPPQFTSQSLTA